mgnify:CR=1 FL=1
MPRDLDEALGITTSGKSTSAAVVTLAALIDDYTAKMSASSGSHTTAPATAKRYKGIYARFMATNPLRCEKCGGEMQIVSFIEAPDQSHVIERILRHCNMWNPPCRASPEQLELEQLELVYVPIDDFAEAL